MTHDVETHHHFNGHRPEYPTSNSLETWQENAEHSAAWARYARERARQNALSRRRYRRVIVAALWLTAAAIIVLAFVL